MTGIELRGRITEDGKLEVDLPAGLPPGDVRITLHAQPATLITDNLPWTEEELDAALTFVPRTGAEIIASGVVGSWADEGIEDSLDWVLEQRRKRQEQRQWSADS